MPQVILSIPAVFRVFFRSRTDTALEVLALREPVAVLRRKRPRPALNSLDRFFWTTLRRFWPRWTGVLVIVKPETGVGWHRAGFRLYWLWRYRPRGGHFELPAHLLDERSQNRCAGPMVFASMNSFAMLNSQLHAQSGLGRMLSRQACASAWLNSLG